MEAKIILLLLSLALSNAAYLESKTLKFKIIVRTTYDSIVNSLDVGYADYLRAMLEVANVTDDPLKPTYQKFLAETKIFFSSFANVSLPTRAELRPLFQNALDDLVVPIQTYEESIGVHFNKMPHTIYQLHEVLFAIYKNVKKMFNW